MNGGFFQASIEQNAPTCDAEIHLIQPVTAWDSDKRRCFDS
jgi:hypothetical protein